MDHHVVHRGLSVDRAAKSKRRAAKCHKDFHWDLLVSSTAHPVCCSLHMEIRRTARYCYRAGRVLTKLDTCAAVHSFLRCGAGLSTWRRHSWRHEWLCHDTKITSTNNSSKTLMSSKYMIPRGKRQAI